MNKIGIFYTYWVRNWYDDFHPYIDKVADLGYDIIELQSGAVTAMSTTERSALKSHLADRGLDFTTVIGLPADYDVASEDKQVREAGIEYLRTIATAIGELGGGIVGGIIYGSWPCSLPPGETDKRPYTERSIASMKEVVRAAEDNNVVFTVEVVNRFEQFIMNCCQEAIDYTEAVGSPNVKIMLDTFHLNIEEDFIGEAIVRAGEKLGHFHVGENNRRPPGYGHIPWTEVAAALRTIDYSGPVVLEPFVTPGGEVGRDIKIYRDLQSGIDLDEDASNALLFIRGLLK